MRKESKITETVQKHYSEGAKNVQERLCCPISYDAKYLEAIPQEVIEKDYGCGDPSKHLKEGETVLDLGSGTGKICFIASQVVGPKGKVIGVDFTDSMLDVARRNAPKVAEKIGYENVEFRKGHIEDLDQNLEGKDPLIETDSIDVIVSNCVLNLVETQSKKRLFKEMFRVLHENGRAVISDIVSDREIPQHLRDDADLWAGCISGALLEKDFIQAFYDAGFKHVDVLERKEEAWRTVEEIHFNSLTVEAFKGDRPSTKCC